MIKKQNHVIRYSEFHVNLCMYMYMSTIFSLYITNWRYAYNRIVFFFRQAVQGALVPRVTKNFAKKILKMSSTTDI